MCKWKAGKFDCKRSRRKRLDVTAIARGTNESVAQNYIEKDLFALTKEDLAILILLLMPLELGVKKNYHFISTSLEKLCDFWLVITDKRLLVVGGAGRFVW